MSRMCAYCETEGLELVRYADRMKIGRKVVEVIGLSKMVCAECGSETVPLDLFAENAAIIERVSASTREAVAPGVLRKFRECWGVSQRDASRMFGAGASAFAKWESGQAELSTPSALLVQCALKFPAVANYLALLSSVKLNPQRNLEFLGEAHGEWRTMMPASETMPSLPTAHLYKFRVQSATNDVLKRGRSKPSSGWRECIAASAGRDGAYLIPMAEAA